MAREHGRAAQATAAGLRARILEGALPGGAPLREVALAAEHGVARNTLRAALLLLEADGLVVIEPNRGARVAGLDPVAVRELQELRTVLETGAARLALARNGGRLPASVGAAAEALAAVCRSDGAAWREVVEAHLAFHTALVAASGAPRVVQAHARLAGELVLFTVQGRPAFDRERLAATHLALPGLIEAHGVERLERHLAEGSADVGAPLG